MIEKTKIHPQGPDISRIVYGVWRINDIPLSMVQLQKIVENCIECGIDWFDHADIYGDYTCEDSFGKMLSASSGLKDKLKIITKTDIMLMSAKYPTRKVKHYDTSPEHIQNSVDNSLKKLGVEKIDILLLHRPDPLMDPDATGKKLDELIRSGKVSYVGVSNFSTSQYLLLQSRMESPLVTNQIEISLGKISPFTDGSLDFMMERKIKPMAWSPLGGGSIAKNETSHISKKLEEIAKEYKVPTNLLAIAWLLRHPSGIIPVIGSSQIDRIKEMAKAVELDLSREDWFRLYEASLGREVP